MLNGNDAGSMAAAPPVYARHDNVMHPKHGLGRIEGVEEREVAGTRERYVILEFSRLALKVGIPEDVVARSGLRRPNSAEDMRVALAVLPEPPVPSRHRMGRQPNEHDEKLYSGQPELLAELLRDLADRRDKGRAGVVFREALARLAEELAVADGVSHDEAAALIEAMLPPLPVKPSRSTTARAASAAADEASAETAPAGS